MLKRILNVVSVVIVSLTILLPYKVNAATLDDRLAGNNRYETGAKIVCEGWTNSDYAVIASGEGFADALCAAPLAKKYDAPILLTGKNTLDLNTKNQLKRLNAKNVFIVGGTGVVSDNVDSEIKGMGIETTRIYGENRFKTSLEVAKNLGDINGIVVTNGFGFADALSIAPVAAQKGMPIILTDKVDLSQQVKDFLNNNTYEKSYIVGGSGVVSDKIASQLKNVTRLGGNSRYGTNAAVLNHFASEFSYDKVYVASGQNYPDALSGSALAALTNSPLILVGTSVDSSVMSSIKAMHDKYNNVIILGGTAVVSDTVVNNVVSRAINPVEAPKPEAPAYDSNAPRWYQKPDGSWVVPNDQMEMWEKFMGYTNAPVLTEEEYKVADEKIYEQVTDNFAKLHLLMNTSSFSTDRAAKDKAHDLLDANRKLLENVHNEDMRAKVLEIVLAEEDVWRFAVTGGRIITEAYGKLIFMKDISDKINALANN